LRPSSGLLTPALLALLAVGLSGQVRTWIVDVDNRPGTDFTDLQTAFDSVPAGDAISIRSGAYRLPVTLRRGLSVVADDGVAFTAIPTFDVFTVADVPVGQTVLLRNLRLPLVAVQPYRLGPRLQVARCGGMVQLENVSCALGFTISGSSWVSMVDCAGRLVVEASSVAADGCTLRGLDAIVAAFGGPSTPSTPAIDASYSTLSLSRCDAIGGNGGATVGAPPGSPAIVLSGFGIGIAGTDSTRIVRGSMAPATTAAIQGHGQVIVDPVVTIDGNGGPSWIGVVLTRVSLPSLHAGALVLGGTVSLALRGAPTVPYLALLGMPRPLVFVPDLHGALGLDLASAVVLAAGVTDVAGVAIVAVGVPDLVHLRHVVFGLQSLVGLPPRLSSPVARAAR